jgi:hypothetical protein
VVPHEQSFRLAEKLHGAGATVELRFLIGAPHDFEGVYQEQAIEATIEFLDRHLKSLKRAKKPPVPGKSAWAPRATESFCHLLVPDLQPPLILGRTGPDPDGEAREAHLSRSY